MGFYKYSLFLSVKLWLLLESSYHNTITHNVYSVPNNLIVVIVLLPMFHSNLVIVYMIIVIHICIQLSTSFRPLSGETERNYKAMGAFDLTQDSAHVVT